jgi:glutathione S-transferase
MLCALKEEEPWKPSEEVYKLNPAGNLPIFVLDGKVVSGNYALTEYLEEANKEIPLMPSDVEKRAEVRRICEWFDDKFYREVYRNIVAEKIQKRFAQGLAPDSRVLKAGFNNLNFHMEYLDWLTERHNYLAGDEFSIADITAAAHISILDYLGDVPWDTYRNAKVWYSKIKSRPSFKDILKDNIKGILPSKHYTNLDF